MASGIPSPIVADKDQRAFNKAIKQIAEQLRADVTAQAGLIRQLQIRPVAQPATVVRQSAAQSSPSSAVAAASGALLGLLLPIGDAAGQSELPATLLEAGAAIDAFELLALGGATVEPADAADSAHYYGVVGIAKGPAGSGESVEVAVSGDVVENPAWSWTPGQLLWVSETAGALATTAVGVTAPKFYQLVGIALTATKVLVWIEEAILIWKSTNADATAATLEDAADKLISTRPDGTRSEVPLVELGLVGQTTIAQSADSAGLQISGFDDQVSANVQAYITSTGLARLVASGVLSFGGTRFLFGTTTDDAANLAQFAGSVTTTGAYKVNNVQVVGAQQAAVGTATASGASYSGIDNLQVGNVYAQAADLNTLAALYDDLAGKFNDWISRAQAHGLIS